MGLKDAMISLVGDFVQMNRNPEFRSKNELNAAGTSDSLGVPNLASRRHSLNITVGAEGPPETFVRNRTYSVCGSDARSKSPSMSQKKAVKSRRSSAPCILKEPPVFQLASRRNRKTSENNDSGNHTETSEAPTSTTTTTTVSDRPRKPIIKKQKSADFQESDSSDDSENAEFQRRRMMQNSPRFDKSGGFFKNGSFRGENNIIEEESEAAASEGGDASPCIKPNVTIITTRF